MIVIFIVKVFNLLIVIYKLIIGIIMCIWLSLLSPYLFNASKICIKVFKAKCGDKIFMWVMVFSATGRCIR